MPLPELLEVVPLSPEQLAALERRKAEIMVPGSKSITNRAIVLAALGTGTVTLRGALWSEDTEAMVDCMKRAAAGGEVATEWFWEATCLGANHHIRHLKALRNAGEVLSLSWKPRDGTSVYGHVALYGPPLRISKMFAGKYG